ncbi:hypothetical protein FHR90_000309 [Endobacter medicaginis]|uniref:Glycosyl transferase family 1 domain-containing protein n=3 Tax=Endobacter medicaginis TaxID=1181271 RepID=A0A839UVV4_9PROT|nr:glycosyltransferase family 1 protein [Endobacter medicaginis]MBB3172503.1 hypothetical protein [Endobacter medicaginis]MCX5474009.1 glycosyltransferase family 1 protein [Endobacter medicaginis]
MVQQRAGTGVLMELRPCFDGFAGIPQETRLLFQTFARMDGVRIGGLLNGAGSVGRIRGGGDGRPDTALMRQAQELISLDTGEKRQHLRGRLARRLLRPFIYDRAEALRHWGAVEDLSSTLDPEMFGDWLWMRLFRLGLPASDRHLIQRGTFPVPRLSWGDAARLATFNPRGRTVLDMASGGGWDIHLAHTPSPYRLRGGRMIVRYHDAIPLLWPHTISHALNHARSHYNMLKGNIADGAYFVCTSEPVRADLLKLFPELETRSTTIPTMSSATFRPDPRPRRELLSIIARGRRAASDMLRRRDDAPSGKSDGGGRAETAEIADEPYVLAVSTLEPRKNYAMLMRAAVAARRAGAKFRLVLLANPGWRSEGDVKLLKQLIAEGAAYHLADIPMNDLRALYTGAHAVICPSRAEGFDLATVEAMSCAAPLLASDIPVHRWVCGDAAEYFDPYDEEALTALFMRVTALPRDTGRLAELAEAGLRQSALYRQAQLEPRWAETIERVARS